jgi:ATP-binding cassette subfamily B protein
MEMHYFYNKLTYFLRYLSSKRRKQLLLILILIVIASFAEIATVGMALPFLAVLTAPEDLYQNTLVQPLIKILELNSPQQLILPLTIIFIGAILFSGLTRIFLLYVMNNFEQSVGADLSVDIYRKTLYQSYSVHIKQNSSDIISGITSKSSTVIKGILAPILTLVSSIFILISVITMLIVIDAKVTLISFSIFLLVYWGIIKYTRQKIAINSRHIADKSSEMIKLANEGLSSIKDILIANNQEFYCELYRKSNKLFYQAIASNHFINTSPRFIIEAIGMTLVAIMAYTMTHQSGEMTKIIPVLGALVIGSQRILPLIQQIYRSVTTINGSYSSFQDVLHLLGRPLPSYVNQPLLSPILFEKYIRLKDVSFRYSINSPYVLKKINITISKGKCIGLVGKTGSGKSTLLNIIIGLLTPSKGSLLIDGNAVDVNNIHNWRLNIAHVPQDIFLSDGTIEENIAFGQHKSEIDRIKIKSVSRQAGIADVIEDLPKNYKTIVGERGVRFSGGQRQRIGIARALYRQVDVLILDEATNSLDIKTENSVINSINMLKGDMTILIIAHRIATLKNCDQIIELDNSDIRTVSYDDLFEELK